MNKSIPRNLFLSELGQFLLFEEKIIGGGENQRTAISGKRLIKREKLGFAFYDTPEL